MASEEEQLYVKLDGYDELLNDFESIEHIVDNVREAMDILEQVRELKKRSLEAVYDNIDRLDQELNQVSVQMPDVDGGVEVPERDVEESTPTPEIDGSIEELRTELESLQDELSEM